MANRQFSAVDGIVYDVEPGKGSNTPNPGIDPLFLWGMGTTGADQAGRFVTEGISNSGIVTLSLAGATTTIANSTGPWTGAMLPAPALIEAVGIYVPTAITGLGGSPQLQIGDGTTVARFGTIATAGAFAQGVGTIPNQGLAQWNPAGAGAANGPWQNAPASIVLTFNTTPTGGQIRVVLKWKRFQPPTS